LPASKQPFLTAVRWLRDLISVFFHVPSLWVGSRY
jgi:hypothetical protein